MSDDGLIHSIDRAERALERIERAISRLETRSGRDEQLRARVRDGQRNKNGNKRESATCHQFLVSVVNAGGRTF